ncbi:hypothetical protein TRVA0_045S00320 [Trichomonascus vanleenenianus]|uniref:uncharacterized protein n=1 Tax=Trichomonascus vanleenenianus TaxID=2268995 RepID=UPI003ECAE16E
MSQGGRDLRSAALYVNNALVSKGYIKDDERLEFSSVMEDGGSANDARVINVIYSLLSTLEKDNQASETAFQKASEAAQERERARAENERLQGAYDSLDTKMRRIQNAHSSGVMALRRAESQLSAAQEELNRQKQMMKQAKIQFANELRKRDIQIDRLKERVLDSRDKSSSSVSGVSGLLSKSYNSYSSAVVKPDSSGSAEASQKLCEDLVEKNRYMVAENEQLMFFLNDIRRSMRTMVGQSVEETGAADNELTIERLAEDISDSVKTARDILNSPNYVSTTELTEKEREISRLELKVTELAANWKSAMQTLEEWKKYSKGRAGISRSNNTRPDPKRRPSMRP